MKTRRAWIYWTVILLFTAIPFTSTTAKGPPGKVVITGPGLAQPVEITDIDMLWNFSMFKFEQVDQRIQPSENPGIGFTITRYFVDGEKTIPWDRLVYYPREGGTQGIVFREGLIERSMSTEFDGYWYPASPEGNLAMQEVLAANLIPVTAQQESRISISTILVIVALALTILAASALLIYRHANPRGQTI